MASPLFRPETELLGYPGQATSGRNPGAVGNLEGGCHEVEDPYWAGNLVEVNLVEVSLWGKVLEVCDPLAPRRKVGSYHETDVRDPGVGGRREGSLGVRTSCHGGPGTFHRRRAVGRTSRHHKICGKLR